MLVILEFKICFSAVLEKLDDEKPIKAGKKKISSFTSLIRSCCSDNFKLRRQKHKEESSSDCNNLKVDSAENDDLKMIDLEINKLIEKKKKINEAKKLKERNLNINSEILKKKEELLKLSEELKEREMKLKKEQEEFYKKLNLLEKKSDENDSSSV